MNSKALLITGGALFALVFISFYFLFVSKPKTSENQGGKPSASSKTEREIAVSGSEYAFEPRSVSVKKDETIRIIFTNTGGLAHNLVIDELGISTKTVSGGGKDELVFTAGKDGTYSFYCSIGNHREQGMEGTISIE